ncbi:hypothetical protein JJ691_102340 [Kutzneria sp. CA-103260]|nr:hypothetical protein JJ691_102340 [Kutzneria sp. CA-103260]
MYQTQPSLEVPMDITTSIALFTGANRGLGRHLAAVK